MSRKGGNGVCEGVVELFFVGVDVAAGEDVAGNHLQTAMVVLEGGGEQLGARRWVAKRSGRGRQMGQGKGDALCWFLSLRPLHNMVELATVSDRTGPDRTTQ